MKALKKLFARGGDDEGATALEYGLLAALIAAVIVFSVQRLGITVGSFFVAISDAMNAVIGN